MKHITVKVKVGNDPKSNVKVGDTVEFQVGDEFIQDKVTFIEGHRIEGENFDLSFVPFKIVGK